MAKEKKLPYILILEDDCKPAPKFTENWPKVKAWLQSNLHEWHIYSGGSRHIKDPFYIGNTGSIRFYRPKSAACTHFIYMHSGAYDSIIKKYQEVFNIDWTREIDSANEEVLTVISYPFMAYQSSKQSVIRGHVSNGSTRGAELEEKNLGRYITRKLFHRTCGFHNLKKTMKSCTRKRS